MRIPLQSFTIQGPDAEMVLSFIAAAVGFSALEKGEEFDAYLTSVIPCRAGCTTAEHVENNRRHAAELIEMLWALKNAPTQAN